jgi:hypothetical protein
MKILKKILLWLAIVIVAISLLAQLIPSKWKVERTIVVQAQPAAIYPLLAEVENWAKWNSFSTNDSAIQHFYPMEKSGVGAVDKWQSKKFGDGSATITKADPAAGVWFDLRFERMPDQVSPGAFEFSPADGGTKITYWVEGKHGRNPVHRIFGLFMGNFLNPMFDESLANIKRLAEAAPVPEPLAAGEVSETTLDTASGSNPSLNVESHPAVGPAAP